MELFDAIFARRSYRGMYLPTPVPREDLRKIMEAALAAPSGCNKQTTSVIAVDDPELIRQFGQLMEAPNFGSAPAGICILTEILVELFALLDDIFLAIVIDLSFSFVKLYVHSVLLSCITELWYTFIIPQILS